MRRKPQVKKRPPRPPKRAPAPKARYEFAAGVNLARLANMIGYWIENPQATDARLQEAAGLTQPGRLRNLLQFVQAAVEAGRQRFSSRTQDRINAAEVFGDRYVGRLDKNAEEKARVAHFVVNTLEWDSQVGISQAPRVLLDAGSATFYVAKALKNDPGRVEALTTTNVHAFIELLSAIKTLRLMGGEVSLDYASIYDQAAIDTVRSETPDVAVLNATAFASEFGIGCHDPTQREMKVAIAETALQDALGAELVVIADHSKFLERAPSIFGPNFERDKTWRRIQERAHLVTGFWPSGKPAPKPTLRQFRNEVRWFADQFGDRLIVLDQDGQPMPSLGEALDALAP